MFGYFRSSCIFESAAALVSLPRTKVGAWRAMRADMWDLAVQERELYLRYGGHGKGRKPLEYQAFYVEPIEVLP